jgi:hypothetical protein
MYRMACDRFAINGRVAETLRREKPLRRISRVICTSSVRHMRQPPRKPPSTSFPKRKTVDQYYSGLKNTIVLRWRAVRWRAVSTFWIPLFKLSSRIRL